jgi:hypothetical protein
MKKVLQNKVKNSKFLALQTEKSTILKFEPKDYPHLGFHDLNRDVKDNHVVRLKNLIKENGVLRFPVVSQIGEMYYFVDGQHLADALMKTKQTIYCFLCKGDYVKNMFDINNSSTKYPVKYCIRALSRNGDKNYVKLWEKTNDKYIKSVLKPALITKLYACRKGEQAIKRKDAVKMVTERCYKISNDVAYCDNVVRQISECHKAGLPHVYDYDSSLIDMIFELGKKYKHNEFLEKVKQYRDFKNKVFKKNEKEAHIQLREIHDGKKYTPTKNK